MRPPNTVILLTLLAFLILLVAAIRCPTFENAAISISETKYKEGLSLYNVKDYRRAVKAFNEVAIDDKNYNLAQSLMMKADSIILIEDVINSERQYKAGQRLFDEGEFHSAIDSLERVVESSIYFEQANTLLGKANSIIERNREKAQKEYLKHQKKETPKSSSSDHTSGGNKFVLTHCLGKKLPKAASFFVDGPRWKLDYNNGDRIYYTVVSGNEANPLCGINTVDSNGDACEICITKNGSSTTVQFEYVQGTLSYTGYYQKD